jgi:GDP-L-fucose synthase
VGEWLYVDDAAQGIILAAERYNETDPLNIAVGHGYTIGELAAIVRDTIGYKGRIVYDKTKPDGALRKTGDITKMKALLNWAPRTPIREGIKRTLDWFIEHCEDAVREVPS